MDLIKDWVINISVTLVFMTAVEMLVVNNSFKKYVKFVLGLILIVVIITPIINLINKPTSSFVDIFSKYEKEIEDTENDNKATEQNDTTKKKIVENLQDNINSSLKNEFENYEFESELEGDVDLNKFDINIKTINIYVYSKGIKPIKKIEVGSGEKDDKEEVSKIKESNQIKDFLGKELNIEKNKINIYSGK